NGLELSSLSCKDSGMFNVDFMKFIFNNEKLLIFKDDKTVAVWDIFNSVREFIKFIPLEKDATADLVKQMTRIVIDPISENEPFSILYIKPNLMIINNLDPNWIELNPSEHIITNSMPYAYGIRENNEINKELLTELDDKKIKYYLEIEPWAVHSAEKRFDNNVK
ncbi:30770_t:CDS:2, partial [Gigaspora margarita]